MKRVFAYAFSAVLLGTVMMLAPLVSFVSEIGRSGMDTQAEPHYLSPTDTRAISSETEQIYGIKPVAYPQDVLVLAFMLTLSLAAAFGVMSSLSTRKAS